MYAKLYALLFELNAVSIAVRLVMSIVFAGIIGYDRQKKHYPAGLRTHIMVCTGSAMTMMLGQYLAEIYGSDPARIGAQVISGIGFLGAGTIILSGVHVKGITTASGLWTCACMGLMIGAGFYLGAVSSFGSVVFTLFAIRIISSIFIKRHPRRKTISVYLKELPDLTQIVKLLRAWGVNILETRVDYKEDEDDDNKKGIYFQDTVHVFIDINIRVNTDSAIILTNLLQEDVVVYADFVSGAGLSEEKGAKL